MTDDNEIIELARTPKPGTWGRGGSPGSRYVRTPEGMEKYGLPMGAKITRDAELRANAKGRNYTVPEDDNDFGSQPPAAGRTSKSAKEFVAAIKASPTPKIVKPDGPKKVAVGKAGYGFPEGSRTFRPNDHPNFAIVRTPDYQLIAISDKGVALELDGDLEKELNAELDDDLSENYTADDPPAPDDPNALADTDGDGQTGQAADPATPPLPARVEDMPGFLDQKKLDAILAGMKGAGLDQSALDAAELQLHRNNNAIRAEHEAASAAAVAPDPNAPDPNAKPSGSTMEPGTQPIPERQPELETDPKKVQAEIEREAKAMENDTESVAVDFGAPDKKPVSEKKPESKPEKKEPIKELRDLEELAKNRPSGVSEGTIAGAKTRVRRNRVSNAFEYEIEDDGGKVTPAKNSQGALDTATGVAAKRAEAEKQKAVDSAGPRDTSKLTPDELTDKEIRDTIADIDDFVATTGGTRAALRRRNELKAVQDKRKSTDTAEFAGGLDKVPAAPKEKPKTTQAVHRFTDEPSRDDILNARENDVFSVVGLGSPKEWTVDSDGNAVTDNDMLSRDELADLLNVQGVTLRKSDANATNKSARPAPKPGDTASPAWANEAPAGAVAVSGDGLVQTKQDDGSFETPIGPVDADSFKASDIEGDDSTVIRTEPTTDNRPVGATKRLVTEADLRAVPSGDGISMRLVGGEVLPGRRLQDGRFELDIPGGLKAYAEPGDLALTTGELWHVPNKALKGKPSQSSWATGDTLKSLDDVLDQKPGTKLRYQYVKPLRGNTESSYTVLPDGELETPTGTVLPASRIEKAVNNGQVSVAEIPAAQAPAFVAPTPKPAVQNLASYKDGDKIADYRHLKNMKPGQTVTLTVPAHQNGGSEAKVTLTRTDDDKVMGGFMFLVGKRGRGYNSFGENNAALFQAIADGRLYYGDISGSPDDGSAPTLTGAWDTQVNIHAWQGGPMFSQAELNEFINSQVLSPAMQTSYYDVDQIPLGNPFRQKALRDEFAEHAMKEFGEPGNPLRHKPAAIRYAAQLLGLKYTDPGSTLIPDDLDLADFKKKVTIGKWLRSTGSPTTPAETNMGPEQLDVTAADLKTAFAAMEAMLDRADNTEDPDIILKRIFARQGSPLQSLNTSVAIAAYYGMRRYRINPDGSETLMTTIARQHDKRKNKELLRNMLREQLEGREPGYYGLPEDEVFRKRTNGPQFVNRTTLSRPTPNSDTPGDQTPAAPPAPAAPAAPPAPPASPLDVSQPGRPDRIRPVDGAGAPPAPRTPNTTRDGRAFDTLSDNDMREYADTLGEEANLRAMASDPLDADEQAELEEARTEALNRVNNPSPIAPSPDTRAPASDGTAQTPKDLAKARAKKPGLLFLQDANGNVVQPDVHRRYDFDHERPLVYDHATDWGDRQDVYELDNSETQIWIDNANRLSQGATVYTDAEVKGKRMFVTDDGAGVALLDGETITAIELDVSQTGDIPERAMKNLAAALVSRGARNAVTKDQHYLNGAMSPVGFRHVAFASNPNAVNTIQADLVWTLDPDYIGQPSVRPTQGVPQLRRDDALAVARKALEDYQKRDFHLAIDKGRAGDGWHDDAFKNGKKLWGKFGASGLLMRNVDPNSGEERFLLVQRAGKNKNSPLYGKWQLPGGGLDQKETDAQGAARETIEEINPPAGVIANLKAVGENRFDDKSGWHYSNLTADINEKFTPTHLDPREILDTKWLTRAEIADMEAKGDMHPALSDSIRDTLATFGGTAANALPTQKPVTKSILAAKPNHGSIHDKDAKVVGGNLGGSNGGQVYELSMSDGSRSRFYVKPVKQTDQGKQEALASDLYRAAGARAPETDYDAKDHSFYSKMMDVQSRGGTNWQDKIREDFAADAWLANWDVRPTDNVQFDKNGNAVRIDNGGALQWRARGGKKDFGNTVPELDTLREPRNIGSRAFGTRNGTRIDSWEAPSAQKVVDVPDQTIRDLVTKHGLNQSLADTLIARKNSIAARYKINPTPPPTPPPAPAAPTVADTPDAPVEPPTPAAPVAARPVFDSLTRLPAHPPGMIPTAGNAYEATMADGSTKVIANTIPKNAGQGRNAEISSRLYQAMGIGAVEVQYDGTADRLRTTLIPNGGAGDTAGFRQGFVADAWLANHSAPEKYSGGANNEAIRNDLRGTLDTRLNGNAKSDFGNTVSELESLRNPSISRNGSAVYGLRTSGQTDDFEWDGAQKVVDVPDDTIRQIVSDAGGSSSLADKLIARKQSIASHYGVFPSGTKPATMRPEGIDAAPSLADAQSAVGGEKAGYVQAVLPAGTTYLDALKMAGSLDNAFDNVWRRRNPGKPDRIGGGSVTKTGRITDSVDSIIDLAKSFELSQTAVSKKAREMGTNDYDPRALHEVLAEQRGFHQTNKPVATSELDRLVSNGQTHVYRTVNPHGGLTGNQAAEEYKKDGLWRRGTGTKQHGEGVYVAQLLGASIAYDHGQGRVFEMAFDQKSARIAPSKDFKTHHSSKISQIRSRISQRSDLSITERDLLLRAFEDPGTVAMMLGYDALYGNKNDRYPVGQAKSLNDFNILNKGKITFSEEGAVPANLFHRSSTISDFKRQRSGRSAPIQPNLQQANSLQPQNVMGVGYGAPAAAPPSPYYVGQQIRSTDVPNLGIGSIITYPTSSGGTIQMRKTTRGWVNVNTNRVQGWMNNLSPKQRKRFTVVLPM